MVKEAFLENRGGAMPGMFLNLLLAGGLKGNG